MHFDCNSLSCFEGLFCLDLCTLFDCHESDLDENWSCKFFVSFLICSKTCWPPSFIRRFLRASPCFATLFTLSLEFSKGELFSFFPFLLHGWNCFCNNGALVAIMPPTLPYIPKRSCPLQGWHLQLCFSMVGITWQSIDSRCHWSLSNNPSSNVHSTSS